MVKTLLPDWVTGIALKNRCVDYYFSYNLQFLFFH